jgi:putative hemolysin
LPFDEFADRFGLRDAQEGGGFHTVAGFVLQQLAHLPDAGERFRYRDLRIEVLDMDGRRVDKVLVQRVSDVQTPPDSGAGA